MYKKKSVPMSCQNNAAVPVKRTRLEHCKEKHVAITNSKAEIIATVDIDILKNVVKQAMSLKNYFTHKVDISEAKFPKVLQDELSSVFRCYDSAEARRKKATEIIPRIHAAVAEFKSTKQQKKRQGYYLSLPFPSYYVLDDSVIQELESLGFECIDSYDANLPEVYVGVTMGGYKFGDIEEASVDEDSLHNICNLIDTESVEDDEREIYMVRSSVLCDEAAWINALVNDVCWEEHVHGAYLDDFDSNTTSTTVSIPSSAVSYWSLELKGNDDESNE